LQAVFEGPVSAGLSDEVVTFFIASEMTSVGPAMGDGDEQITVHTIALSNIHAWLDEQQAQGKAVDCKVYTALELYRRYQPGPIA
jgi:ADP-ribose pyrophosphatase